MTDQTSDRIELKAVAFEKGGAVVDNMAGDAGDRQVRPGKRIVGIIMLAQPKISRSEAGDRMTLFTFPAGRAMRKFSFMVIIMAIKACRKLESRRLPGLVAFLAGDIFVFPLQRVPRAAVVEIGGTHRAPAVRGMAVPADRSKAPFVDILMTIGTLCIRNRNIFGVRFIMRDGLVG